MMITIMYSRMDSRYSYLRAIYTHQKAFAGSHGMQLPCMLHFP